jgi:hypothetical protein
LSFKTHDIEALRTQLKELETLIESLNEQKSEQLFLLNELDKTNHTTLQSDPLEREKKFAACTQEKINFFLCLLLSII